MNSVQLTGRFTRDPEIRYGNSGSCIAAFTVAVDRRYKAEGRPTADFIRCKALGKTAEFIEKYFTKGMKIEINGRIETGSYQNQEGQTVYTTEVMAEQVGFAESKNSGQNSAYVGQQNGNQVPDDGFMNIPDGIDEELPFN